MNELLAFWAGGMVASVLFAWGDVVRIGEFPPSFQLAFQMAPVRVAVVTAVALLAWPAFWCLVVYQGGLGKRGITNAEVTEVDDEGDLLIDDEDE